VTGLQPGSGLPRPVAPCLLRSAGIVGRVFTPEGPSLRELGIEALSSVDRGYDLLAPKFDYTPFRTSDDILEETAHVLSTMGPFENGLDVCCGTGAGLRVLQSRCRGQIAGVDFSAGMLAQARSGFPDATLVQADARSLPFATDFDLAVSFGALGHFLPTDRSALFAEVHRVLRPGGLFAVAIGGPPPFLSGAHLALLGFDLAMLVRNTVVVRPQFVMYYSLMSQRAIYRDLATAGFRVEAVELTALGRHSDDSPRCSLLLARKLGCR
jgi:ubiquinone/menaquinone biosynthesis C-methylase UbiE